MSTSNVHTFTCCKLQDQSLAYTNKVYVSSQQYTSNFFLQIGSYVFLAEPNDGISVGFIGLNKYQREFTRKSLNTSFIATTYTPSQPCLLDSISISASFVQAVHSSPEIDANEFMSYLKSMYAGQIFRAGQWLGIEFEGKLIKVSIHSMEMTSGGEQLDDASDDSFREKVLLGMIGEHTAILIEKKEVKKELEIQFNNLPVSPIFNQKFSFEQLGIGGLDNELTRIFRRAFASRLYPAEYIKKFKIKHIRGIILYGPPGTGKTLIARQIGKVLNSVEPRVVNGPEILDKMVGGSEGKIRELFSGAVEATERLGDNSPLHLIILDELDAICRQRGSMNDSTGVHDSIVNQLLAMMDGVKSLNNILVIGMTNRLDMIDKALTRAGRFEVNIEIGLPDEKGRQQILGIHTSTMKENGLLATDVDLADIAARTKNYSGAELEGVIKSATSYALNRPISDIKDIKPSEINCDGLQVTKNDFECALLEVKPAFGIATNEFKSTLNNGLIHYNETFSKFIQTGETLFKQIEKSPTRNLLTVLLQGPNGSGKTTIASHLAVHSSFAYAKIISAETLLGLNESGVVEHITTTFFDAYKSPFSVVVLDDLENLIQYIPIGARFSTSILSTLITVLKKRPPTNRKLMIIGTTSEPQVLSSTTLSKLFNVSLTIPSLDKNAVRNILTRSATFEGEETLDQVLNTCPDSITVKQLLLVTEMASTNLETIGNNDDNYVPSNITLDRFEKALLDCYEP